jgi:cell fate regulator YaaT (PSP1 superfamily)
MERELNMSVANVVGVQFRRAGKIYDFSPGELVLKVGDQIVVDTERGPTVAKVVKVSAMDASKGSAGQLKTIMRLAGERDLSEEGQFSESQMMDIARGRVESFKLDMRIMKAEAQMGGNKVIVYFSSPGRVDFRDLVKDLAGALRSRVELKQVGARDEAKLVGGLGICGREYCCSSFLRDFVPVSIKMAKNQNLALNPSKVSGGCGRLLCCLTYENDAYLDLRRKLPALKSRVRHIHDGDVGLVIKTDILNQNVVFETADGRLLTAKAKDVEAIDKQEASKDQMDSEADMWAEDIDLGLLMNEPEDRPKGSDGRQQHAGGQQQKRRDYDRRDRDGEQRRQEGSSGRRHHGRNDRRTDADRAQQPAGSSPKDRKGRDPKGNN